MEQTNVKASTKTKTRNLATANPDLIIKYIDNGYSPEQWADITEAMRKHDPDPKAFNVFPRGPNHEPAVKPRPSVISLLTSRQVREQLSEAQR